MICLVCDMPNDHDTDECPYGDGLDDESGFEVHCYLCYLDLYLKPDTSERADQGPLRSITKRSISRGADPYEVLHLSCGHAII